MGLHFYITWLATIFQHKIHIDKWMYWHMSSPLSHHYSCNSSILGIHTLFLSCTDMPLLYSLLIFPWLQRVSLFHLNAASVSIQGHWISALISKDLHPTNVLSFGCIHILPLLIVMQWFSFFFLCLWSYETRAKNTLALISLGSTEPSRNHHCSV